MLDYTTKILSYDTKEYPFAQIVRRHFGRELARLHEAARGPVARLEVGKDQQTEFHKTFYAIGNEFHDTYQRFVRDVILRGERASEYLVQKVPTFRVHLPGNVATGGFHKDSDYNHALAELNFIIPMTMMHESATVWVESQPDVSDFAPVNMDVGNVLRFWGAGLTHGSYPNQTGRTRVSVDFRVLPKAKYEETTKTTLNMGMPLTLGKYYMEAAPELAALNVAGEKSTA